jgi:hypothetical protein
MSNVMTSVFRSLALASVLAVSAGIAAATTVSLRYDGATAGGSVDFIATPTGVTPVYDPAGAFGFRMTDVTKPESVLGSFIAWCLDLTHPLGPKGTPVTYTITSTPFTNSYALGVEERKRVQSVFDANFANVTVTDKVQAAGFQVALWNALYDTDQSAGTGDFAISAEGKSYTDIVNQANLYLTAAFGYSGTREWNLRFLQSNDSRKIYQNLVTATPVPVPAAAGLLLMALGGLAAVGRRRRTA